MGEHREQGEMWYETNRLCHHVEEYVRWTNPMSMHKRFVKDVGEQEVRYKHGEL